MSTTPNEGATPRTDAAEKFGAISDECNYVHVDFARQLERELAAATALAAKHEQDAKRLDWLEKYGHVAAVYQHRKPCSDHNGEPFWKVNWTKGSETTRTLRAAIDAAMRGDKEGGQ